MPIVRSDTVGNLIYRFPVFLAEEREREEEKPELGLPSLCCPAFSEMETSVSHHLTFRQGEIDRILLTIKLVNS